VNWRLAVPVAIFAALIAAAFWPVTPKSASTAEPITVMAAASLADALPEIGDAFEQANGPAVQCDFASSGILMAKIEAGARPDLFIAASSVEMDQLQFAGRVKADDRRDLLRNRLVCVVPRTSTASISSPADLEGPSMRRIAIGDPAHVPAGRYAREALLRLGLWERLRPRIVPSADVRAALAQAESGAVDAAIVYRTDAAVVADDVRTAFEFSESSHAPIRYPAACLAGAPHPGAARAFLDFLTSAPASAVFSSYGFTPVGGERAAATGSARPAPAPAWNDDAADALRRSLRVSLIATLLMVGAGAPIALWLARRRSAAGAAVESLLSLPLVLPPVVTGYLFLLLFSPQGPLGRTLERIGLPVVLDWKGAVIASAALAFALFLAVAKVAFSKADPALEAAARTLNASPLRVMATVTLPPALPGLAAGAVLAFARAFGEFGATMMLAGNIPGRTRTVPQAIYTQLVTGQTRAAWGLVGLSVAIGIGAIIGANLLLATWRSAAAERPGHA
jgi:molybdate transport system permease protein